MPMSDEHWVEVMLADSVVGYRDAVGHLMKWLKEKGSISLHDHNRLCMTGTKCEECIILNRLLRVVGLSDQEPGWAIYCTSEGEFDVGPMGNIHTDRDKDRMQSILEIIRGVYPHASYELRWVDPPKPWGDRTPEERKK